MSTEDQAAPPEGALIRLARKARGLSVKKAVDLVRDRAPDIRLGESRWYHIEGGTEGKGKIVSAPDDTLAHMAYAVGLTPDRLEEVGRQDAAEVLEEILRQESTSTPAKAPADANLTRIIELWPRLLEWQRDSAAGIVEQFVFGRPASAAAQQAQERRRRTG